MMSMRVLGVSARASRCAASSSARWTRRSNFGRTTRGRFTYGVASGTAER
jgi:hypothetical protein